MRNPAAGFIKRLTTQKTDDVGGVAAQKEKPRKPHEWRGIKAGQLRTAKRIQARRQANTNKRFQRARAQQLAQAYRDRELRAVVVLAEFESRIGVPPGGVQARLIEEGKLTGAVHTPMEILAAYEIDDEAAQDLYEHLRDQQIAEAEIRVAKKRQAAQAKLEATS